MTYWNQKRHSKVHFQYFHTSSMNIYAVLNISNERGNIYSYPHQVNEIIVVVNSHVKLVI